jgi:hypothetical protein
VHFRYNNLITIKALKLPGKNSSYNFFTCNPTENKEYTYRKTIKFNKTCYSQIEMLNL